MILSAQKIIYWPKMQAAIPQESVKCSLCAGVIVRRSRENRCCLLNSFGRTYSTKEGSMICCCGRLLHYSDWFEVNLLNEDMTATSLSKKKAHFVRYGVPDKLYVRQWVPVYLSRVLNFAKAYDFKLIMRSTYCITLEPLVKPNLPS